MSMTKRCVGVFLAMALTGGGSTLAAQQGLGGGRGLGVYGLGPRLGENIELALEFQEQLGLSVEQVAALQEIQVLILQDVAPLEAEIDDLRGRMMSGEVVSLEGVSQLQDLRTRYQAVATPYRTGVATILTAEQHRQLQGLMFNTRLGERAYWGGATWGYGRGVGWGAGWGGFGRGRSVGLRRGPGLGFPGGVGRGVWRGTGRGLRRGGWRR